jgi:histidine ammonia-lyase
MPRRHLAGPSVLRHDVSVIVVDGEHLSSRDIAVLARREDTIELAEAARERAARSYDFGERTITQRPIYGRSTGVGANRDVVLADPEAQADALMRSHATTAGEPRSRERIRAMLAVRLNQLAAGGSGTSPDVLDALTRMIADDCLPPVRELGSIGTGDLPALAITALALAGLIPTMPPMATSVPMGIGNALPFMSSNAATIGDAALGVVGVRDLAHAALVVAGLSFVAVDGNPEAFDLAVEQVTPFEGARYVCRTMRRLVTSDTPAARIQDQFGLRTLPQVHGALIDQLALLDRTIIRMANAPSENPVLLPDLGLAHHGGFHAAYLAQALDSTALSIAEAAQLAFARLTMLSEPAATGLPPFLGDGTPGASGVMVVEYVAASALARLRALATPASLQSLTLSRGIEEDASIAALAAGQVMQAVDELRVVLACELVAAVRCVRMRSILAPPGLVTALADCAKLSDDLRDRDLTEDLDLAGEILADLVVSAA